MNLRPSGYEPDELPTALLRVVNIKDGGGRWIRTIEVVDNRFTVCPLWPLGNPSTKIIQNKSWSRLWDSNPQPADYKSAALPIELNRPVNLVNKYYYTNHSPHCQQFFLLLHNIFCLWQISFLLFPIFIFTNPLPLHI